MREPRAWQRRAIDDFDAVRKQDFLISATPAAGKTDTALYIARRLVDEGSATYVVVVAPTDALRQQWADKATPYGLHLMPVSAPEDYRKRGYDGCVVTYAQIVNGVGSDMLRRTVGQARTVAIIDEIHHAGVERAWGDGLRYALDRASFRIALTGTPWRSDTSTPIPYVTYDDYGRVRVDHAYEYGAAVADGVCRRIEFHAYTAQDVRWVDCGRVRTAELGTDLSAENTGVVLDTIYRSNGVWISSLLRTADGALSELREVSPDLGGLIVAETQEHARAYAQLLERQTGVRPHVAVSDDPEARQVIDDFRSSTARWLVAVRMVSEGVDIPRLGVGVFAAKTRTPLFFRQVVGRFVRTRPDEEFNARLFMPAVSILVDYAREIEIELRHQIDLEGGGDDPARRVVDLDSAGDDQRSFPEPLSASEAIFDRAILGGNECSPAELVVAQAECRRLGVPEQYAVAISPLIREAQVRESGERPVAVNVQPPAPSPEESRYRQERLLRSEVETLARKVARRAGIEPKEVNTSLLKDGFPARAQASIGELEKMRERLASWLDQV